MKINEKSLKIIAKSLKNHENHRKSIKTAIQKFDFGVGGVASGGRSAG